jgi:hypothetical protein
MSLNEARSVVWPFRDLKGEAIGSLVDKGLLSLQDLGYAAQRAYDWQVREATRTMLLHALSQVRSEPENSTGPLNVVATQRRSYAERRQLEIISIEGAIAGFMLCPLPFLIWRWFHRPADAGQKLSSVTDSIGGIILVVVMLIMTVAAGLAITYVVTKIIEYLFTNRLNEQLQLHRKGQLGEERALNVMYGSLDGKWWLFRNLELPGRRLGDLDSVLVGPHGVWSFEVKAYSGEYRNVGEQWEKRYGTKWRSLRKSPTRQARRNAAELSQLLETNQIKQWVTPVIIWANPESTVLLNNPSTSVWTLDQLSIHLKKLSGERPVPEAQIQKIVDVLKKICQENDEDQD